MVLFLVGSPRVSSFGLLAAAGAWPINLEHHQNEVACPLHPGE